MRVELSRLFVLDEAFLPGAVRADFLDSTENVEKWAVGECAGAIALRQFAGKRLEDLVGTTRAGFYLLSRRLTSAMNQNGISGWKACETAFEDAKGRRIDGYSAIVITAQCGPLQNERSKEVTYVPLSMQRQTRRWIGIYFEECSWDGSDLFRPRGTMLTVATARAKETIEALKPTNIRFRPLLEVERLAL
jgi:hypothetical protein